LRRVGSIGGIELRVALVRGAVHSLRGAGDKIAGGSVPSMGGI
jgi:hypothetical protein